MSRVNPVTPEKAKDRVKDLFEGIAKKMGRVPNLFQNLANSPAVLEGYLNLSDAVGKTSLNPKLREQIALAVGQINQSQYCISAHTTIGGAAGLKPQEVIKARQCGAEDPKTNAILKFAKRVIEARGKVSQEDVNALKGAGISDAELVEIILVITINLFTNYFNNITDPKVDFPEVPKIDLAGVK